MGHFGSDDEEYVESNVTILRTPLTMAELPPPDTKRWGIRRKAAVVEAIRSRLMTEEDACRRYGLSPEELASWMKRIKAHGVPGLRVTRLTRYRAMERECSAVREG
ncbi:MAG: DUF1153 domain-containing protein [Rhodospirillaceae bacterium]|nr:DUF1153 domain-containing protein [Rhodospirillaceae bacterium]